MFFIRMKIIEDKKEEYILLTYIFLWKKDFIEWFQKFIDRK